MPPWDVSEDREWRNRRRAFWPLTQTYLGRWCGGNLVLRFFRQTFCRCGMWWFMGFFPRMRGCIEYTWALRTNVADAMHRIRPNIVWVWRHFRSVDLGSSSNNSTHGAPQCSYWVASSSQIDIPGTAKARQSTLWFLAHMKYHVWSSLWPISLTDYVDFMGRARWKTYQEKRRMVNYANYLSVFWGGSVLLLAPAVDAAYVWRQGRQF